MLFNDHNTLAFRDGNLTVFPIKFTNPSSRECFSFLCVPKQGPRTFLPQKAKQIKGLVPKLHYKLLTDGQSVTLEDGRVVTPDDVCADPTPSQCVAFIFLPDSSFLDSLLTSFEQSSFGMVQQDKINKELHKVVTVYHSIPKHAMFDTRYLDLMASHFGPDVTHILDCPESNIPVLSKSKATFFTERLKMVCPLMFPTAYAHGAQAVPQELKALLEESTKNFTQMAANSSLNI